MTDRTASRGVAGGARLWCANLELLACRKRRIKCGEERPICGNCVKSKRNCEGYNQRVVFKDPMNAFRPTGSAAHHAAGNGASFDHVAMQGGPVSQYGRTQSASNSSQAPLPTIAPKPSYQDGQSGPDGVPVATTYNTPPDYPYAGFDPAQITPPYPPGDRLPKQGALYNTQYVVVDKNRMTPDEYHFARSFPGQRLDPHFPSPVHPSDNFGGLNGLNGQQRTDIWPESTGQNGKNHGPFGPSLQNHANQVQQSGDQTIPSRPTNGSLHAAQYHQRHYDPKQATIQRSSPEGDDWFLVNAENKPLNVSAQSVLQQSMQNGWLVNQSRKPTVNGKS